MSYRVTDSPPLPEAALLAMADVLVSTDEVNRTKNGCGNTDGGHCHSDHMTIVYIFVSKDDVKTQRGKGWGREARREGRRWGKGGCGEYAVYGLCVIDG
jgi:hypothetical protein